MSKQVRVALDTAVVLQALLGSDAKSKRLRAGWQGGQFQALIGRQTAQVLMKALSFPALQLSEEQQLELLADFLPYAEVVNEQEAGLVDEKVRPLLALAMVAPLDCVVSDCSALDADFSRYAGRLKSRELRLVNSEEFLQRL